MADLILHNYPISPFAEKIRAVLGYKKLPWKSVIIPAVMPKPDVVALTGGYRKTPILQVGADIYCDSALICNVLEHLAPEPPLFPVGNKGLARVLAQWADTTLFWAAMAYNFGPKGMAQMFGDAPPESRKAFSNDRRQMSGTGMTRLLPDDATAAYKSYLRRLSDMLDNHPFLLGTTPCVADFAAYHPLWFTRCQVSLLAGILDATPQVLDWMDRMQALGHGSPSEISSTQAVAIAHAATPLPLTQEVFQDEHGIPLGSRVTIAAESFGPETTEGELLAATRMHYSLRRTDPRAGTVHVHFPRIGYVLKRVEAA